MSARGFCKGDGDDHCCYVNGSPCRYLEENTVSERRWACGLRRIYGNWDDVHSDEGYLKYVKPCWDKAGIADCGDWPPVGTKCNTCGVTNG